MSAHSPGPWRVVGADGHALAIWDAEANDVVSEKRGPMRPADASLLAAAPELLKALQDLADRVVFLAEHGRAPALNELEREKAVAVLAKARGEGKP